MVCGGVIPRFSWLNICVTMGYYDDVNVRYICLIEISGRDAEQ